MKKHILCSGNIAFDLITTDVSGKDGILFQARPGGSVFNTAILLSRLGLSVSLLAKTGRDFLGDSLINTMRNEKIKTKYVIRDKNVKTGFAIARIDKKGDSSYLFYKPKSRETAFKEKEIPRNIFDDISVFHTASAYSYNDFTFANTLKLMRKAKRKGVFVSYDPNWRAGRIKNKVKARKQIKQLLPYADLIKLSESDAIGITGARTVEGALKHLKGNIIITRGAKGAVFMQDIAKISCKAYKIPVVDTIGAGDGFTAGLIYSYCLKGEEAFKGHIRESLALASASSALVCMGRGATSSLKNLRQVKKFMKDNGPHAS